MKTKKTTIDCPDGTELKGLLWGNNAAWICKCGEWLGNRTAQCEKRTVQLVVCDKCGLKYGIVPGLNDSNNYYLGSVESVHVITDE